MTMIIMTREREREVPNIGCRARAGNGNFGIFVTGSRLPNWLWFQLPLVPLYRIFTASFAQ